jgi:hypothetical protein
MVQAAQCDGYSTNGGYFGVEMGYWWNGGEDSS